MTIKVIRPGLFSSFQDTGRVGFQHWGVPVNGAMDQDAHALANLLVGNPTTAATLEMTIQGPVLCFQAKALIALAGADLGANLDGAALKPGHAVCVKPGAVLRFEKREYGARAYLAVSGGYLLQPVMNSRSTYSRGGFGGQFGRALSVGDVIPICSSFANPPRLNIPAGLLFAAPINPVSIRVLHGREWADFSETARHDFLNEPYQLTAASDRMGYRLDGAALDLAQPKQLLSESVAFGTVQVPAGGQPIVLMADRQTTGGYPRIAQVASVDLPKLAQLMPGDGIRFSLIDLRTAQALFVARMRTLKKLEVAHS
ncbi:biotin-dependent carboxyltransferase family protein [Pseudomonas costantinii]|uniref:5-oxoprolinase subunit C family protein n=1 Tax=Pseudomonas costantinii TaxID=168469 RepID=UPI0015A45252|nr:biotin-dependent carboxyltransferase family protein [Pseudomonas costantinii]NVZ71705.1 biotin-dependent carboxyltransferase family protein [Pseudomonas costantinii]